MKTTRSPLLILALSALAIGLVIISQVSAPPAVAATLGTAGALAILVGFRTDGRRRVVLLLIAGIALGGWRGMV